MFTSLFFIQLVSSLWMCSLIWVIQLVHYPLFLYIDDSKRIDFSKLHQRRISALVMPTMLLELLSLGGLLYLDSRHSVLWLAALFLAIIWASTVFLQVPQHKLLSSEINKEKARKSAAFLVKSNWLRTLGWSIKTCLIVWLFLNLL